MTELFYLFLKNISSFNKGKKAWKKVNSFTFGNMYAQALKFQKIFLKNINTKHRNPTNMKISDPKYPDLS